MKHNANQSSNWTIWEKDPSHSHGPKIKGRNFWTVALVKSFERAHNILGWNQKLGLGL